ncbi:MAG: hypothetical protein KAJ19_18550 [Gammaproteobacteria bacterium]|nr:hypothetical protein [Gammaproteobacteria bacterium]
MITDIDWKKVAKAVKDAGFTVFGSRVGENAVDFVPMKGFKEVATFNEIIQKTPKEPQSVRNE